MNTPKLPTIRRTTNSTRPHSRKSGALASNRTRQRDPTDPIGQPARGFETYRIPYGETPAYASATRWILSPAGFGALPVFDGTGCGHSTAGRAVQKALMDQKGLNDVFQGALVLSDRRGQGFQSDGSSIEFINQRAKQGPVEGVKTRFIHLESLKRKASRLEGNAPLRVGDL